MSMQQPVDPENRSLSGLDYVMFELVQSIRRYGLIVEVLPSGKFKVRLGNESDTGDDKPEEGITRSW